MELLEARNSEADYRQWLQDVKKMLANGREDGLAMALAENMAETRRQLRIIKDKDEEIRRLQLRIAKDKDEDLRRLRASKSSTRLEAVTSHAGAVSRSDPRCRPEPNVKVSPDAEVQ